MIIKSENFHATFSRTMALGYWLTLPDGYTSAGAPWPLILFLHGAGERGSDLEQVRQHGIPRIAPQQENFPFITLAPQCPANHWWSDYLDVLIGLLDTTLEHYAVDPDRIYLTGLSMGGYGTWHLAAEYPDRFAAIAPICGGGLWAYGFPERVADIRHIPAWVFHGAKDELVPLRESEVLVNALREAGGDVQFTVYPEAGHDSWTETYDNPALYDWFRSHARRKSGASEDEE